MDAGCRQRLWEGFMSLSNGWTCWSGNSTLPIAYTLTFAPAIPPQQSTPLHLFAGEFQYHVKTTVWLR
jgi:hypothetical protein